MPTTILQELFGGPTELGAAVLRSPGILLMGVDKVCGLNVSHWLCCKVVVRPASSTIPTSC